MNLTTYVSSMDSIGNPLDELGILTVAVCTGKDVAIMLNGLEFWTTRVNNDWQNCEMYFAYIGDNVFVPIECVAIDILNKVAQKVPLKVEVKKRRGRKPKITLDEEKEAKEKKIGRGRGKSGKNSVVEPVEPVEPKRRGRKRKSETKQERIMDEKSCAEAVNVKRENKKGLKKSNKKMKVSRVVSESGVDPKNVQ